HRNELSGSIFRPVQRDGGVKAHCLTGSDGIRVRPFILAPARQFQRGVIVIARRLRAPGGGVCSVRSRPAAGRAV
ncbi:hypothetical protein, partial [Escherichia albertii]|uniref:hypothetical protein n=1 Tax=Escherichia albertii TaxID=208962 RepID=UPI0021D43180